MKTPLEINARVRVNIKNPKLYAGGAAESLHGKTGTVERLRGAGGLGFSVDAALVRFDSPAAKWWAGQTPPKSFWFEPSELEMHYGARS
jgi:hypothetical protein